MKNKIMSLAATSLATMLFFVASIGAVRPLCLVIVHEPDIPEALK